MFVFNENNHNHAHVQDDLNFYRYPTYYFISENYFHLQTYSGSDDFNLFLSCIQIKPFSLHFNEFASN